MLPYNLLIFYFTKCSRFHSIRENTFRICFCTYYIAPCCVHNPFNHSQSIFSVKKIILYQGMEFDLISFSRRCLKCLNVKGIYAISKDVWCTTKLTIK